jgi:hypothetical protein
VEHDTDQELKDRGVQLRKDRALIINKLRSKMQKLRRAYDRFCDQIMAEFGENIPKLLTSDKGATPGAGAEHENDGSHDSSKEEELVEEEEPAPPPKCPFDTDDAFIATFNSDPAVIGFKVSSVGRNTAAIQPHPHHP